MAVRDWNDEEDVLFIVGMARSGTTLLADLIAECFDYGMGPEGSFVPQFSRRLWWYGDLNVEKNFSRLLYDVCQCEMLKIARDEYSEEERFDVTPEMLRARTTEATYASVVRAVFRTVADCQGRSRLGTKYPLYWRFCERLEDMFGERAHYVWIVRDGRDAALSLLEQPWGEDSVYACAQQWTQSMLRLARIQARVGTRRLLVIKYEDLLHAPAETLRRVAEFTGSNADAEVVQAVDHRLRSGALARNFGKWRAMMPADDVRRFEAISGQWLDAFGYERNYPGAVVTRGERVTYGAAEYARRLRRLF